MMPDPARLRSQPITQIVMHSPTLASLYVAQTFDVAPGQFVNVWLPGVDEKPISISAVRDGQLELSVKAIGPFTQRLMAAKAGDWLGIRGPFGNRFSTQENALLVAGGIGWAPLRFLEQTLRALGLGSRVLLGVRTRQELIFPDELPLGTELASDDGSLGRLGLVTDLLQARLEHERPRVIYGAGPEPMLLAVRSIAKTFGVPVELTFERYMKCGFGICGQCCMDGSGLRLCVEGPVLGEAQLQEITELGLAHRTASGRRSP